jgi:hypothetical protein
MHKRHSNEEVPITATDMERFHRNAPAAIKRREGTYAFDEFGNGLRSIFLGGVPLIGLLWFDWSSSQLMFFLLVGTWVAILCDFAKLWFLEKSIREWAAVSYDDWQVWTVAAALRAGRNTAAKSHLHAKYEPWVGVLVDIVFGGLASVLIPVALAEAGEGIDSTILRDQGVMYSLIGLIAYQVLFTVWEIVVHKRGFTGPRQVKVKLGMRGLGLFLLMFLLVMLADNWGEQSFATRIAMLVINSGIVFLGVVTMVGPFMIRRETQWLREYLAKRKALKTGG